MELTTANKLSFPNYSEIIYLDELMRAALEQDNTEEFRELTENLKRTERGISSNSMIKRFLTILSLTDSAEKLSAFIDYIHTPFSTSFSETERNDYARPITDAMMISIVREDLETARQLLNDRSNTFVSAVPMYYIMLTKRYSLIPDCLEFMNRDLESSFNDILHRRPFEDELAYVIASAAVHRDSEFLTELFGCGYKLSVLAIAFLTNRPDAFDFLANTWFAYSGRSGEPSEFVRTALSPEYQLNFVLCTALLNGRETVPDLLRKYSLPEKMTAILSSDIRFLETQSDYLGGLKESVKALLDDKLTIVIDDNYTYFALNNSLTEGRDITFDVRHYDDVLGDFLFKTEKLTDFISHNLIVEQSGECSRFVGQVLHLDDDGSLTRLLIKNGVINKDNISNVRKFSEDNMLTSVSSYLEEYINEQ